MDELSQRPPGVLDRDGGVDPVLVVEVENVDAEPLQRGVTGAAHVVGPAVDAEERAVLASLVAELGGEHHLVAPAGDGLPDEPLVGERAVHVRGVEEGDAEVQRPLDGALGLRLVTGAVELAHPHAAQSLGRDGQPSQCACLHGHSPARPDPVDTCNGGCGSLGMPHLAKPHLCTTGARCARRPGRWPPSPSPWRPPSPSAPAAAGRTPPPRPPPSPTRAPSPTPWATTPSPAARSGAWSSTSACCRPWSASASRWPACRRRPTRSRWRSTRGTSTPRWARCSSRTTRRSTPSGRT